MYNREAHGAVRTGNGRTGPRRDPGKEEKNQLG